MDRNRDGRRGNVAAMNGLSRRRPRSGSLRDSPEEDGGTSEMQESTRLRDRGGKKDRDRDRSSRSKRRRGDRMLHGSNREEGEDSTDESMDEEEDEDDDDTGAAVRLPPPPPLPPNPSLQSSALPANHSHRKSLLTKVIRPPPVWKVADEMIGVSVPRKARSASAKRSHDCWLSGSSGGGGGGGGGSGEQTHRQPSTSPSRPSQAAAAPAPISPSSSNPSVRKKTKQICVTKHRPPKISKSSSSIQEIEFEVAEVLYGLTRQFQASPKQDAQMPDSKDANGSCTEIKSRASSPNSLSPLPAISQSPALPRENFNPLPIVAPKRKRPRPVKFEDENPTSTSPSDHSVLSNVPVSSTSKTADVELPKMDSPSPKSEKSEKTASTPVENGVRSLDLCSHPAGEASSVVYEESKKPDISTASDVKPAMPESDRYDRGETAEEPSEPAEEPAPVESDINDASAAAVKTAPAAECPREKCEFDLMAPPPGKSSPERDSDFSMGEKCDVLTVEMGPEIELLKTDGERCDSTTKPETGREVWREEEEDKGSREELDMETPIKKETSLYLQLEIDKYDEGIDAIKQPALRQQPKVTRAESKQDRPAQAGSLPPPVPVAGWPGGLPFGYMGQVPSLQAVIPMDGSPVAPKAQQPQNYLSQQLRPKRCATHCHIAQNIYYHQQLARINPFWSAAAGSSPFYGAKPYNLNVVPTADSAMLNNPLQACFPVRGLAALQDKVAPIGSFSNHPSKEKGSPANFIDAAQRKQLVLQQPLQAGSTSNMLPAPAFIFPLNQPPAAVAASRMPHVKFTGMNVASSSNCSGAPAVGSGSASASAPAVNFSYANLPQAEAQYLLLQNHGYPFPIPTHVGAPPYRGANHTQAMPFFSNSMYASQMLHPSQHQPQPQPQPQPQLPQQGPQNASTSTGSSSSQKHTQHSRKSPGANASGTDVPPNRPCTSKQRQHLPAHPQARQLEGEMASEDSPSTADSRISQPQKGMYNHNFVMPPNFALMSSAAALNSGVNQNDKVQQHPPSPHQQQHPQQNMKVELAPSQSFAMSFAAFAGSAASGHHGLDFSAVAQNHAIFQSLPDMARHGYQLSGPAAAAQSAQHKKAQQQPPEGGKFVGEPMNAVGSHSSEDERKAMLAGKASSGISQHSLSFSRPDSDPSGSAIVGNNVIDGNNARTLNLIPASVVNGGQAHSRPTSATPASAAASSPSGGALNAQQQQQLIQLQKKQQQQQQLAPRAKSAGSSNNVTVYNDNRLPAGTAMPKFPNLAGFPQALIHASNPTQSPQWKNSARTSTSVQSPPNPTPPVKTHLPQQQSRTPQPTNSNVGLLSQISFGMASMKSSSAGQQQSLSGANSIQTSVSVSVAAATAVGSPPTSVSKGGGGSPRAPSVSKISSAAPPTMSKGSAAGSSQKSSPVSNRSVPSILGQPHIVACPSSVAKSQQQHQQQQQLHLQKQQQQFPAAQLFFANSYLPAQSPHSNAAASATPGYHQRRPSEQQQPPHPNSPSVSTGGMLSLCSDLAGTPAATSDPTKAVAPGAAAATSLKGLPSPSLLQAAQFAAAAHAASGTSHTLVSAAGFPYSHAMPSVSVKPVEQKPAAGSDALHAYWQPEKR